MPNWAAEPPTTGVISRPFQRDATARAFAATRAAIDHPYIARPGTAAGAMSRSATPDAAGAAGATISRTFMDENGTSGLTWARSGRDSNMTIKNCIIFGRP